MMVSYILGFAILIAYVLCVMIKDKKIPESISSTVYSLSYKDKWIYTLAIFATAFLIAPYLFEISSIVGIEYMAFLTIGGALGTGAMPLVFGEKNTLHYASAIVMALSSQYIVYSLLPSAMLLWIPYVIYTLYMENGKWNMFFGEIVMITTLLICGILV